MILLSAQLTVLCAIGVSSGDSRKWNS